MNKMFTQLTPLFVALFFSATIFAQIFNNEIIPIDLGKDEKENLILIDADGDGLVDIVRSGTELVLFNNIGNLEFSTSGETIYDSASSYHEIVDYNKDGLDDILVGSYEEVVFTYSFRLLQSNGDGTFENILLIDLGIIVDDPFYSAKDIDDDGNLDIILSFELENRFLWYEDSENGFELRETITSSLDLLGGLHAEFMDYDNDQLIDIVITNLSKGRVILLKNNGNNSFDSERLLFEEGQFINEQYADLDSDGDVDMLIPNTSSGRISWLRNVQGSLMKVDLDVVDYLTPSVKVGNLNLDSDMDILLGTENGSVITYLNDGFGEFEKNEIALNDVVRIFCSNLADFDLNQTSDLLLTYSNSNNEIKYGILQNVLESNTLNLIESCTFFDENNNGIQDGNENEVALGQVTLEPNSIRNIALNNGCSRFFVENGEYVVEQNPNDLWQLSSDSSSYTIFINNNDVINLDFGYIPRETLLAGQMHTVSGITRCNRATRFDFIYKNIGTTVITEGFVWGFPDSLLTIANEINPLDTFVNDFQWAWKFEDLYPGQTIKRSIELNIPGLGGEIEPGTLVTLFSATQATDTQGFTNFFKHNFESEILCAYDPNDKLIRPDREGDENYTLFQDTLIYTVRFQNTGNDTAFTVVVRDTLDQNLDVSTFSLIGSSHREVLTAEILDDRFMTFTFEDILLPDSTVNFNGSQGYVSYSIRPIEGLPEETIIENTASIFFDFNPPIVTNTTQNTLVECLPISTIDVTVILQAGETYTLPDGQVVSEPGTYTTNILNEEDCPLETTVTLVGILTGVADLPWDDAVRLSPNPTKGVFYLDVTSNEAINHTIHIQNILGAEILSLDINSQSNKINVENLISGIYYLHVRDKNGSVMAVKKLMVE